MDSSTDLVPATIEVDRAVTTLALLIRKPGMSRDLFSRYWRDVHGVLAARIPGFDSYVQYHLNLPLTDIVSEAGDGHSRKSNAVYFDGLAVVSFHNIAKRAGLATSDVTAMIQQDEQNVFGTSLLFNLNEGASRTILDTSASQSNAFILLGSAAGSTCDEVNAVLDTSLLPALRAVNALCGLRVHMLWSGEQHSWRTEGVDNEQSDATAFDAIVQLDFEDSSGLENLKQVLSDVAPSIRQAIPRMQVYPVGARHVMVNGGKPTELGLRGLDIQRTIAEAGASNQRSEAVLRCVFGDSALGKS